MPVPCYSSDSHGLTLRELLEVKREIAVLEAKFTERLKAMDMALQIQAKEYERRLEHLNGEQARIKEERAEQLPRENFELYRKEQEVWRETVNQFTSEERGKEKGLSVGWAVLLAVLTLGMSSLSLVFHFLK